MNELGAVGGVLGTAEQISSGVAYHHQSLRDRTSHLAHVQPEGGAGRITLRNGGVVLVVLSSDISSIQLPCGRQREASRPWTSPSESCVAAVLADLGHAMLLWLASSTAPTACRTIVNDHASNPLVRRIGYRHLLASAALLILLGTLVIYLPIHVLWAPLGRPAPVVLQNKPGLAQRISGHCRCASTSTMSTACTTTSSTS
jgi:succinate dehydrogenase / fumarate reductase membrane anchor subunit